MTHRVIMITGAARGIGRTIAEALAPDHDLSITYKTAAQDAAVFCQSHPNFLALQADLRKADPKAQRDAVIGRLKGLVNNAGIRVNAVVPVAMERDDALRPAHLNQRSTDETALSRLAELDEIAQTVRFLLSQAASGMTGTILPVSAGFRL